MSLSATVPLDHLLVRLHRDDAGTVSWSIWTQDADGLAGTRIASCAGGCAQGFAASLRALADTVDGLADGAI